MADKKEKTKQMTKEEIMKEFDKEFYKGGLASSPKSNGIFTKDEYGYVKAFLSKAIDQTREEVVGEVRKNFLCSLPFMIKPSKKKEFLKSVEFFSSILELALKKSLKEKDEK